MQWLMILPEILLAAGGLAVVAAGVMGRRRETPAALAAATFVAALVALWPLRGITAEAWWGMLVVDSFALFFKALFALTGLLVVPLAHAYVERRGIHAGEFYALIVFAVLGMSMMASSRDLLMIYLGLELLSIGSYVLAGMLKDDDRSLEASLKYFLVGAMTSALLLFGLSLVYGISGSTHVEAIRRAVSAGDGWRGVAVAGMWFMLAGFGFKVAAVPFHMWAPDVYHGAPTPVAALLIAGSEAAAFSAILRVFTTGFGPLANYWQAVFAVLAVATMTYGNAAALVQTSAKRMMAYSAIAQAGYVLVGLAVGTPEGFGAMLYYLLAYLFMVVGTFAVIAWLSLARPEEMLDDFEGLGRSVPWVAAAVVIFMISFIGIPPTAGFLGKFYLIRAAVSADMVWLAVVMVVNSAISAGYYYSIVRRMYLTDRSATVAALPPGTSLVVGLAAAATVLLMLFPQPIIEWLGSAQQVVALLR
ncbi:NADH-quinone oxidoreductase subunit N [Geochorda subterranea]|uniref:NADH-quinone oxidoreductase subunit N n=1 Tax=Geochorda subterranea TaxID=3109564 RepID=A0ABZ1BSQ6_9FIRM|nr:NADH-quinone oxidoreductase subunit N [Limnochorda sp. LNt]WRP15865.1 NADH-quinone oxidoreductase subunit N [Limnochorda sp. LNt]